MNNTFVKSWLPPALLDRLKPLIKRGVYYSGNYTDWRTAGAHALGYDARLILEKVKESALKVLQGQAAFERDSVLFDHMEHSFPVLAGLLRAAAQDGDRLSVLDFGGSLGSSYFQCREFLSVVRSVQWGIVEQEHFVRCGRESFESENLRFFYTIADCVKDAAPNVALVSSVLQYLPEPYGVLEDLMAHGIKYIVVDRTPFSDAATDRLTVQHVPEQIYPASYPCWIFANQGFREVFRTRYEIIAQFDSDDGSAIADRLKFSYAGMILRKL